MKKVLSFMLVLCMVLSAIPSFAEETPAPEYVTQIPKYVDEYDDCSVAVFQHSVWIQGGDYGETPTKLLDNIEKLELVQSPIGRSYYAICADKSLYVWGAHGYYKNMMPFSKPSKYTYVGGMLGLPCNLNVAPLFGGPSEWIDWSQYEEKTPDQKTPVKLLDGVKQVVAGDGKVVALCENGEVYIWGEYSGAHKKGEYKPKLINSNAEKIYVTGTSPALNTGRIGVLEKDGSLAIYSGMTLVTRINDVSEVYVSMYLYSYTPVFLVLTKDGKFWEVTSGSKTVLMDNVYDVCRKGTIYIKTNDGSVYERVGVDGGYEINLTDKKINFGELTYEYKDGDAYLTKYEGSDEEVIIEPVVKNCDVKVIGEGAFSNCESVKKVVIPDTVTTIGQGAFDNCASLEEIVIPDTVTNIETKAFTNCHNLKRVVIGNGIKAVKLETFIYCGIENLVVLNLETEIFTSGFYSVYTHGREKEYWHPGSFESCRIGTIYAPSGSKAEQYALERKIRFVSLDAASKEPFAIDEFLNELEIFATKKGFKTYKNGSNFAVQNGNNYLAISNGEIAYMKNGCLVKEKLEVYPEDAIEVFFGIILDGKTLTEFMAEES